MEKQQNLPKNIRQIGQVDKKPEIYIEDYVIAFAHKLAKQEDNKMRIAVLLGKPSKKEEKTPIFIKGAVKITGVEENGSTIFTNKIWSDIYENVKNYFSELEVVGWLLLKCEQQSELEEIAKEIHKLNFSENGNLLFVVDKEEKEENFYQFENGQFEKQSGYYIYYEKNESMQNYMIDLFGSKSQEIICEDKIMDQMRELISNKDTYRSKRVANFVYAISTALVAVVLVIGVTTLNTYDKMENMEKKLANIEENNLVVETITGTIQKEETQIKAETELKSELENGNVQTETVQEKIEDTSEDDEVQNKTNIEESKENESKETMVEVDYYIVKKGDTLVTIAGRLYGSNDYIEEIQNLNQIENRDMIYEGQKLRIPKIK